MNGTDKGPPITYQGFKMISPFQRFSAGSFLDVKIKNITSGMSDYSRFAVEKGRRYNITYIVFFLVKPSNRDYILIEPF